jgi:pyruvate dehydrogenase E1 component beta subunit
MTFVESVNGAFRQAISARNGKPTVVFGQNVSTGSCLSGLTRGLGNVPGCTVINTPNAENTLTGMGFGLMVRGVDSLLCLKQQDFLLLGLDHLVNTWNALRHRHLDASLAVVAIVVDNGWEGPQSCLNNLDDFCSFSRIPGYVVSNRHDAELVALRHLFSPGVKLIAVSQRLWRTEPLAMADAAPADESGRLIRYRSGRDATVVSCNLAFPQAHDLVLAMGDRGLDASLFGLVDVLNRHWEPILTDVRRTGRLVVVDDSKSVNRASQILQLTVRAAIPGVTVVAVDRDPCVEERSAPNADTLLADVEKVMAALGRAG